MSFVKQITNDNGKKFSLYLEDGPDMLVYLLALPENFEAGKNMVVESYNSAGKSRSTYKENVMAALSDGNNIENILMEAVEDAPIVLPITPDLIGHPDSQQLSKDSIIDMQIDTKFLRSIEDAKRKIKELTGISVGDKIFLNGYSASGVFAQRFSLIHPEIVDRCLIGGAAGTIPLPTAELNYPLGVGDYETLFGRPFDAESFKNIHFGYYVAENEEREPGSYDKKGQRVEKSTQIPMPMHDMSFRGITTPAEVGIAQRALLGQTMDERLKSTVERYKNLGIDISSIILRDANHAGIFNSYLTRVTPYLISQILNFYYKEEPLHEDGINTVKNLNDSFQKARDGLNEKSAEPK